MQVSFNYIDILLPEHRLYKANTNLSLYSSPLLFYFKLQQNSAYTRSTTVIRYHHPTYTLISDLYTLLLPPHRACTD